MILFNVEAAPRITEKGIQLNTTLLFSVEAAPRIKKKGTQLSTTLLFNVEAAPKIKEKGTQPWICLTWLNANNAARPALSINCRVAGVEPANHIHHNL